MWILPLVGYIGVVLGFAFLTLAIASGLYYLSELVEEHTVIARKVLSRLIYTIIASQLLLLVVDRFPFFLSALGVISHVVYLGNLRHFPIVKLSDPIFLLSCLLVFANHLLWFRYFSQPGHFARSHTSSQSSYYDSYSGPDVPTFTEVASFFGICVWLVPFALFVSLSASENVLPSMGSEYATGGSLKPNFSQGNMSGMPQENAKRRKKGLITAAADWAVTWFRETGQAFGIKDMRKTNKF